MAFSAHEVRVLRRALDALDHAAQLSLLPEHSGHPDCAECPELDVPACRRLARVVDEAGAEAARQRAFLLADLERYRGALPGAASGYLERLHEAINLGSYVPGEADLEALKRICAECTGSSDRHAAARRALLLVRATLPAPLQPPEPSETHDVSEGHASEAHDVPAPTQPLEAETRAARTHCPQSPARNRSEMSDKSEPRRRPVDPKAPAAPRPSSPQPARPAKPVPTPAEVFPPRRRPAPPSEGRAAVLLN